MEVQIRSLECLTSLETLGCLHVLGIMPHRTVTWVIKDACEVSTNICSQKRLLHLCPCTSGSAERVHASQGWYPVTKRLRADWEAVPETLHRTCPRHQSSALASYVQASDLTRVGDGASQGQVYKRAEHLDTSARRHHNAGAPARSSIHVVS